MNASAQLIAFLSAFEGLRLTGYLCPARVATIGWGHTETAGIEVRYNDGTRTEKVIVGKAIDENEAKRLKALQLTRFEGAVTAALKGVSVEQYEFDACVSLAYNIGPSAFAGSSVVRHLKRGDRARAAQAFLLWNKAGGRVMAGLSRRRAGEKLMFEGQGYGVVRETGNDMPQRVDAPRRRRSAVRSETGMASIATGAGGALSGGLALVSYAGDARQTAENARGISDALGVDPLLILTVLGLVVAAGAAFIFFKRWQRARDEEV
jgi:lysozyme